jgi:hypothetical protein
MLACVYNAFLQKHHQMEVRIVKNSRKPTKTNLSVLNQICKLIPGHLVSKLAREHGVDKKARTFSPWSHVVTLLFAHLSHASSLNGVCDAIRTHETWFTRIRNAKAPTKNTLSHANRNRDPAMAEALFWTLLEQLKNVSPRFGGRTFKGMPRRFKRAVYAIDSSTIQLVANCIDWAKHRRRKAAAKLHLRLDLRSYLPAFAIVDTAKHNDNRRAREICAGLKDGEIALFDKAYIDFEHLLDLTHRGVFWVTRAKDNMAYRVKKRNIKRRNGNILRDDLITLTGVKTRGLYPDVLRLVRAIVEVDGKQREMTFITNNTDWAAASITDLYKSRWAIETFFKEIKQTLQLSDFLGHNKNAVQWQVWTALIAYVLLRYQSLQHGWQHGFKRFFCLVGSNVWSRYDFASLIEFCGTARGSSKPPDAPQQRRLPGFQA